MPELELPSLELPSLDAATVTGWRQQLTATATGGPDQLTDAERVDLLRALEELSCAAAGVQAVVTAGFDDSQRAAQAAAGVPADRCGRGVGAQVGLAGWNADAAPWGSGGSAPGPHRTACCT